MSADAIKRICFVGIGNMGWPMAARLVRAGFEVAVTDAVAGRATAFVDQVGGKAVASLAEATKVHRDRYHAAVRIYLTEADPRSRADVVIDNHDFARPAICS